MSDDNQLRATIGDQIIGTAIEDAEDAARVALALLHDASAEIYVAFYLSRHSTLVAWAPVGIGSSVSPVDLLVRALYCRAMGVVVVRNHRTRSPVPTKVEISVALNLVKICSLVDIAVLDLVVVSREGYCSLDESGRMPGRADDGADSA